MTRVSEFNSCNIAKLLLSVFIVVALLFAIGVWIFYSPGRSAPIEKSKQPPAPTAQ
jgi:hypothetical protein